MHSNYDENIFTMTGLGKKKEEAVLQKVFEGCKITLHLCQVQMYPSTYILENCTEYGELYIFPEKFKSISI